PPGLAELLTNPEALNALLQSGQLDLGDLIGKTQQPTSFQRDAAAAGKFPGTPAFAEAFEAKNRQDPNSLLTQELVKDLRRESLIKEQTARLEQTESKRVFRAEGKIAIRNTWELTQEAISIMQDIRNTVVQSGIPGGDQIRDISAIVGAVQAFFGKDSPQATVIAQKRDRLKKLFAVQFKEVVENLKSARGISDQRQRSILEALPTLENLDIANVQLLGDVMRDILDGADIALYEVEGREAIEAFIADPVGFFNQTTQATGESVSDFASRQFDAAKGAAGDAATFATEQFNKAKGAAGDEIERRKPQAELLAKKLALEAQPFLQKAKEGASTAVRTYGITQPTAAARGLADLIRLQCLQLDRAVSTLRRRGKLKSILEQLTEVNRLENEADTLFLNSMAELFRGEMSPVDIIKWRDIYDQLELATDSAEQVAHVLEGIVLKHA
ncbi:hypothetical protein LCGC14_2634180, partial [marine sediment metagenome]